MEDERVFDRNPESKRRSDRPMARWLDVVANGNIVVSLKFWIRRR